MVLRNFPKRFSSQTFGVPRETSPVSASPLPRTTDPAKDSLSGRHELVSHLEQAESNHARFHVEKPKPTPVPCGKGVAGRTNWGLFCWRWELLWKKIGCYKSHRNHKKFSHFYEKVGDLLWLRSLPTFSKSSKTLLSIPYKVSRHRGQLGFRSNQGPWSHFKKKKQLMLLSIGGWFFFSKTSKKVDVFCWMAFCLNVISAIFWVSGEYTRYGRMNLRGHVVCHFSWVPLDMPTFRTSLLIFLFTLGMFFETRIRSKQKKGDHSWTQRRG